MLGHAYAPLVEAISRQAGKMIHCSNLYYTEVQADAAAKLVKLSGLDRAFFGNSGAEANEGAIKVARKYAHSLDPGEIADHHGAGQFPWPHDRDARGDGTAALP